MVVREPTRPRSEFLRTLEGELIAEIVPELETTIRVAVCTAGGMSRAEINVVLSQSGRVVDDVEVKMALRRLERIATRLRAA